MTQTQTLNPISTALTDRHATLIDVLATTMLDLLANSDSQPRQIQQTSRPVRQRASWSISIS